MRKFSVIVPLYNCEKYIKECLDSILAQTYENFEIVVVNDGSTDASLDIVNGYNDDRIRVITQANKGLFHARATGIRCAQNDICLFVDADDMIKKDLLKTLSKVFDQGYDCVVYGLESFFEEGVVSKKKDFEIEEGEKSSKEPLKLLLEGKTVVPISCKAFYKKLIDINKLEKYPRIAIGEDALYTLELYEGRPRTFFMKEKYYLYRQNLDSMTHKLKISHYTDCVYRILKYRQAAKSNFEEKEAAEILKDLPQRYFKFVLAFLFNPRYVANKDEYKAFVDFVATDEVFKENCEENLKKCGFIYRFLIKKVQKKRYRELRMIKKAISILK